jgi:hypothetical protein
LHRTLARAVEVGLTNDAFAEVASGLGEGEAVIAFPGEAVVDGVAVAAQ